YKQVRHIVDKQLLVYDRYTIMAHSAKISDITVQNMKYQQYRPTHQSRWQPRRYPMHRLVSAARRYQPDNYWPTVHQCCAARYDHRSKSWPQGRSHYQCGGGCRGARTIPHSIELRYLAGDTGRPRQPTQPVNCTGNEQYTQCQNTNKRHGTSQNCRQDLPVERV